MTVEEIFIKVCSHMAEGVAYHEQLVQAFEFLGLWGFAKCQVYHQFEEAQGQNRFRHYYAAHYFKLLRLENFTLPEIIPSTWYKYSTQAVDTNTKKNSVKDLLHKWVEWERSTKALYQEMRRELDAIGEYDAARKLNHHIHDVSTELHDIEKLIIKLEGINYDMITIEEMSDDLKKQYTKKLGW